ncbi:TetR/AcrR family transcriptional regulator [Kitasatospora acidiphila]|uniref:TetR/AcrR family transcriptional regulator n=1 Tax=Kitasatospora acidiphila TaxID=2567942 RepID=A0A540WAT1_9ACTN|nr:TetR/AcrR family transcriptional regulator [Kitasatospora acidiphila]TQF06113.1 TetR/AcrR family transcriptional regulator [Kitasatospora acidiphila]
MDTPEPRPHTGRRRNEAARQAILDAALRLAGAADGASVTIDAIARAAGVGKQTVYRWWPSKGAVLLDALIDRAGQDVTVPDAGTLHDELRSFVATTFEAAQQDPTSAVLRALLRESARDPHLADLLQRYTATRRAVLHALLERGRARGELATGADLDLMVDQVYGLFWYRFVLGHGPLDAPTAERLTATLLAAAGQAGRLPSGPADAD